MSIILKLGLLFFKIIYGILKLLPSKKKVLFLSRQSNTPSIDITMLENKINELYPDYETVVLSRKIGDSLLGKISYCFHMFTQCYHLATSKVVILDSYSILTSCLSHKKDLLVIQMWHSVGTMKKFGYSILDKGEGSSSKIAHIMKMHEGYDYILASSDAYKPHLAEGFNQPISKIVTLALPRVELLKSEHFKEDTKNKIISTYPQLSNGKKNIVYCPTFRKEEDTDFQAALDSLGKAIDMNRYNLILKAHPLDKSKVDSSLILKDDKFSTFEMLTVSDLVISDYSCVIYEAAILEKPLFFYTYDYEEYMSTRDIYMDYKAEVPGPICENAAALAAALEAPYDMERLMAFTDKYVDPSNHHETESIARFIFSHLK